MWQVGLATNDSLLMPPSCRLCVRERLPIGSLCPHQKYEKQTQNPPNPHKKTKTLSPTITNTHGPVLDTPTRRKQLGEASHDRTGEETSVQPYNHTNFTLTHCLTGFKFTFRGVPLLRGYKIPHTNLSPTPMQSGCHLPTRTDPEMPLNPLPTPDVSAVDVNVSVDVFGPTISAEATGLSMGFAPPPIEDETISPTTQNMTPEGLPMEAEPHPSELPEFSQMTPQAILQTERAQALM